MLLTTGSHFSETALLQKTGEVLDQIVPASSLLYCPLPRRLLTAVGTHPGMAVGTRTEMQLSSDNEINVLGELMSLYLYCPTATC